MLTAANALFSGPELNAVEFTSEAVIRDPVLAARIARCHQEIESSEHDGLKRQQAFAEVLEILRLRYGQTGRTARNARHEQAGIARAIDCMTARLEDPGLSINELADAAGLSSFYFMRSFRATTGMTAHAYFVQLRLALAQYRLAAGEPAANVATDCVFSIKAI